MCQQQQHVVVLYIMLDRHSGGNDNKVCIWSLGNTAPSLELTAHQAAVKAMAWAPFQSNLLATGGGSADRTIKFHNTSTGALLNSVDAESQVLLRHLNGASKVAP